MKTKSGKPMRICFDRVIPHSMAEARHLARRAAATDAMIRLGAASPRAALSDIDPDAPGVVIGPRRMALINSRKWETGSTLRCRFLQGSKKQRKRVADHAEAWMEHANIKIQFVDTDDAEVRIAFNADDGSWSAVGTDALVERYFPRHQPTMNFGWLADDTADEEYRRVVLHEFGHALGCVHEHQSPTHTLNWDKEAVYEVFSGRPNFWSKSEIEQNVLQKYSKNGISATLFDPRSIMLYQFDARLFADGVATPLNTKLSKLDIQMIGEMYPFPARAAAPSKPRVPVMRGGGRLMGAAAAHGGAAPGPTEANDLVREGIKQAIYAPSIPPEIYEAMTIADVRRELEEALAPDVDPEANRLMHLNVAVRRRFRKAGWGVNPPPPDWYIDSSRQSSRAPVIADYILSQPISPA